MAKKITFHNHEVVGAQIAFDWMKSLGFSKDNCYRVKKLINAHQFRFYPNSSRKSIRKWVERLGKRDYESVFTIRVADRKGNLKNEGKPATTKEMTDLVKVINEMIEHGEIVFREDLKVQYADISMHAKTNDPKIIKDITHNLMAIVREKPYKNDYFTLLGYVKNYMKGNK